MSGVAGVERVGVWGVRDPMAVLKVDMGFSLSFVQKKCPAIYGRWARFVRTAVKVERPKVGRERVMWF